MKFNTAHHYDLLAERNSRAINIIFRRIGLFNCLTVYRTKYWFLISSKLDAPSPSWLISIFRITVCLRYFDGYSTILPERQRDCDIKYYTSLLNIYKDHQEMVRKLKVCLNKAKNNEY